MRARRWSTSGVAAVTAVAVSLGACGGSGDDAAAGDRWARAVDRVCADTRRALAAEGRPESLEEAPDVAARNVQVLAVGVRRALRVPVPDGARRRAAPLVKALRAFQAQPVPSAGHHDAVTMLDGLAQAVDLAGTSVRTQALKAGTRSCMTADQLRNVVEPLETLVFVERLGDTTRVAEAASEDAVAGLRAAGTGAARAATLERLDVRVRRAVETFDAAPIPAFVRAAARELAWGLADLSAEAITVLEATHGRPFRAARAQEVATRLARLARRQLRRHERVLARVAERYPPVGGAVSGEPTV